MLSVGLESDNSRKMSGNGRVGLNREPCQQKERLIRGRKTHEKLPRLSQGERKEWIVSGSGPPDTRRSGSEVTPPNDDKQVKSQ